MEQSKPEKEMSIEENQWYFGRCRLPRGESMFDREPWGITLVPVGDEIIEVSAPGRSHPFGWNAGAGEWQGAWRERRVRAKSPRSLLRWIERIEDHHHQGSGRAMFEGGGFHCALDDGLVKKGCHTDDDSCLDAASASLGMGTKMLPSNRYGFRADESTQKSGV